MRTHLLALVVALVHCGPPGAQAQPSPVQGRAQRRTSGGIRTDKLSRKELKTWRSIVTVVMAEGAGGQPLHPTLRALWDAIDTSGHTVYVTLRDPEARPSCVAGRFTIAKVDPEGKTHEAIIVLNRRVVDHASTIPWTPRAGGFIRFEGLGRMQRYAEVLGHELAHAVWILADTRRARLVAWLQDEVEQQPRMLLAARAAGLGSEIEKHVAELDHMSRELEDPAEAAEVLIWQELRAGPPR